MRNDEKRSSLSRLAWANFAGQSAEQMLVAGAAIFAVATFGAGPGVTGLLQAAQTLPLLLFAVPAGLLVDRHSRRALMAGAEGVRAVALAAIAWLAAAGLLGWPPLALAGFVAAIGTVLYLVGAPALVPALVEPPERASANARIELMRTVAVAAGPAMAGVLIERAGAAGAFGAAAAMSALGVGLLLGVREPKRALAPSRAALTETREGAAFVFAHALLRPMFWTQFVFNVAMYALLAAFVPYAMQRLGLSAAGTGLVLAAYGVGLVAGALSAARAIARFPLGNVIGIGPVSAFAASLLMLATLGVPSPALAAASFFLLGVAPMWWVVSTVTLRQALTPAPLQGRASAIFLVATGGRPLGALAGAATGAALGSEACLGFAAVLFGTQAVLILASPVVRLRAMPAPASG